MFFHVCLLQECEISVSTVVIGENDLNSVFRPNKLSQQYENTFYNIPIQGTQGISGQIFKLYLLLLLILTFREKLGFENRYIVKF